MKNKWIKYGLAISLLLIIAVSSVCYIRYANSIENKHKIAEHALARIIKDNRNRQIWTSEGVYYEGEWIQHIDIDVKENYRDAMPYTLNELSLLFMVDSVNVQDKSDEYITYKVFFEDGFFVVQGSNYRPTIIRIIVHVKD